MAPELTEEKKELRSVPPTRRTRSGPKVELARTEAAVDGALVQRFNGGDEAAFVEIVGRYREKLQTLAGRFLRNDADAEEIAQDTFMRAHRGLAKFRGDSSLATWLYRIAVNLARNRYWYFFRRGRHRTLSLDCPLGADGTGTFSDLVASADPDPVRQATTDEFVGMVTVCMTKLEDGHREILTLRNLMHRSYEEIAQTLGISEGTVKSRIARARGRLRGLMTKTYPEFPADCKVTAWFDPARGSSLVA